MDLIKKFGKAVDSALGTLAAKNHRTAYLNRMRAVIRCEERAAEKEYLALGRYYYNALRDKANPVAEPHCAQLDAIEARLESALDQMRAYAAENPENLIGVIVAPGGAPCPCQDGDCEEIDLADIEIFDQDPTLGAGADKPQGAGDEGEDLPYEG